MTQHLDSFGANAGLDQKSTAKPEAQRWTTEWLQEHVADPAKDSAVEAVSVLNFTPLGKPTEHRPTPFGTPEWLAETGTKFAVGIVPYVVLGRLTGAGSRAFAEANGLERTVFGKFASSDMQTQVAGAALFDAARNPKGDETRIGNVTGNAITFGLLGSRLGAESKVISFVAKPMFAGALGNSASQLISQPLDNFNFERVAESALTAPAILVAQHGFSRLANGVDMAMNRGIPAQRYADLQGWSELPSVAGTDARLTRVVEGAGPIRIDNGKTMVVPEGASAEIKKESFAHELLGHKVNETAFHQDLDKAQLLIEKNPEGAMEAFLAARRSDELFAQLQTAKLLGKPRPPEAGNPKPPPLDPQHESQYANEAKAFLESGGTVRPRVSYIGGDGPDGGDHGGGHHDGAVGGLGWARRLARSLVGGKTEATSATNPDIIATKFEKPSIQGLPGTEEKFITAKIEELIKPGSNPPEYIYKKVEANDGTIATYDKRGIQTPYGIADYVRTTPDKHSTYHIVEVPKYNPEQIKVGSTYDSYPGGTSSRYGQVHSIETQLDGTKVYRSKHPDEKDNFITWEFPEGNTNYEYEFGNKSGHYNNITLWKDAGKETWMYVAKDGSSLFQLPEKEFVKLKIDGVEAAGVRSVFRAADGTTVYADKDNNQIEVTSTDVPRKLHLRYLVGGVERPEMAKTADRVTENYQHSIVLERMPGDADATNRIPANAVEILPRTNTFYTPGSVIEVNTPPKLLPQGRVLRTEYPYEPGSTSKFSEPFDYLENGFYQRYTTTNPLDGKTPTRDTLLGQAYGHWLDRNGNVTYHLRGHDVLNGDPGISWPQHPGVVYPKAFDGSLPITLSSDKPAIDKLLSGKVINVERSLVPGAKVYQPDGSPVETGISAKAEYITSSGERVVVPLGNSGQIYIRKADGSVIPNTDLGTKLVENYSTPQETPFGKASALTLRTEGSATFSILDNPDYIEVRQYVIAKSVNQIGAVNFVKHMKDGSWIAVTNTGAQVGMTGAQFKDRFGD